MAKALRQFRIFIALMLTFFAVGRPLINAQTLTEQGARCTCRDGQSLEAGVASYSERSLGSKRRRAARETDVELFGLAARRSGQ
jgi:hypothetical protein